MGSLTTVYLIGIILASLSGMASAFVGERVFPLKGGDIKPQPESLPELEDEEKPPALEDGVAGGRKRRYR